MGGAASKRALAAVVAEYEEECVSNINDKIFVASQFLAGLHHPDDPRVFPSAGFFHKRLRTLRITHAVLLGVNPLFPPGVSTFPIESAAMMGDLDAPLFSEAHGFVAEAVERSGRVLVMCRSGNFEAPAFVIATLMVGWGTPYADAHRRVLEVRPNLGLGRFSGVLRRQDLQIRHAKVRRPIDIDPFASAELKSVAQQMIQSALEEVAEPRHPHPALRPAQPRARPSSRRTWPRWRRWFRRCSSGHWRPNPSQSPQSPALRRSEPAGLEWAPLGRSGGARGRRRGLDGGRGAASQRRPSR